MYFEASSLKQNLKNFFNKRTIYTLLSRLSLLTFIFILWNYREVLGLDGTLTLLILRAIFFYLLINLVFSYTRVFIIYIYHQKNNLPKDHTDNFTIGVSNLIFFISSVIFFFTFLYLLGIELIQLFTTLSIVAVAIVLIFREYIVNFLSGFGNLFTKNFSYGDYIKIGDAKGRITNVSFQSVEIKNEYGDFIYVPNSFFQTKEVTNYSKDRYKKARFEFTLGKDYYEHFDKLKRFIYSSLLKEFKDLISDEKSIKVKIDKISEGSIFCLVEVKVSRYNAKVEEKIRIFISEKVLSFLAKNKPVKKE